MRKSSFCYRTIRSTNILGPTRLLVFFSRLRTFASSTRSGTTSPKLENSYKEAIAISALVRSCAKRQPRGVFTVAGDPERYKDGRRDLQLSLREHFVEHIDAYNRASFDNHLMNVSKREGFFASKRRGWTWYIWISRDVPRSDDNCYMKRYHFLEGVSSYWQGVEILAHTKVKKLKKPFTPFSYRRTALDAFDLVCSPSSPSPF